MRARGELKPLDHRGSADRVNHRRWWGAFTFVLCGLRGLGFADPRGRRQLVDDVVAGHAGAADAAPVVRCH